ncbi:MAG: TauD/TfdA family dioxygenase, partial [Chromatiales bacterium]|nr:TauD/TfdA family dioxygenase [Chromatiales bacterium]
IRREHFPAHGLHDFFSAIHDEVEHGVGFVLLRGLPTERLTYAQQVALALGMSDHVGRVIPQNYEGHAVVDVRDEGVEYSHRSRGYRGNERLPFHTDGANLFTLTCLAAADVGGETVIASAGAVYDRLTDACPHLVPLLERGFFHHRRGQHDPGEAPLSAERVPVFAWHDGLLHCCYNRNPIEWAEREGVALTQDERAALDAMDDILARDEMQLRLHMKAGDCLVVNNFVTLHSRTKYEDADAAKRHMLRIWMTDPASRRRGFSLLDLYVPERLRRAV